jgi:hypothetical protein
MSMTLAMINVKALTDENASTPLHLFLEEPGDAEIRERLKERFMVLREMTQDTIDGSLPAFIASGPPGFGKTYTIEEELEKYDDTGTAVGIMKGYSRPTGLYKKLFQYRLPGQILLLDDIDSIFWNEDALNIIKCISDTTKRRVVTWGSEAKLFTDDGELVPKTFEFQGSIIFVTNLDFDMMVMRNKKLTKHLEAIMSRSMYLDMAIKTVRDMLIRIRMLVDEQAMLNDLSIAEKRDVIEYIELNYPNLRELPVRTAVKLGRLRKSRPNWRQHANLLLCRQIPSHKPRIVV